MTGQAAAHHPGESLRVAGAFVLVTVIWGSTWLVIKDQIGVTPASWTVTWRFVVAAVGMGLLARLRGEHLAIGAPAQRVALLVGFAQFCLNFQFVYRAEVYLTSGIVSIFYALLMVPNAVLSRVFLKAPIGRGFVLGSAVAIAGIALLLLHEYRVAPPQAGVLVGVALALGGLLAASVANVLQASPTARETPVVPFIFWAMVWGVVIDVVAAWILSGPPVLDPRPRYWAGVAYLGIMGSVVTFPLYFHLIRLLGAGRAAYNGVAVPVVAMLLSTLFEGYRWTMLAIVGSALAMIGLLIALGSRRR